MIKTTKFKNIHALHADMTKNNQFFTIIQNEINKEMNHQISENSTIYRILEMDGEHLTFCSNQFGGSSLFIRNKILSSMKIENPNNGYLEYRLIIEGCKQPLVLLGCKEPVNRDV